MKRLWGAIVLIFVLSACNGSAEIPTLYPTLDNAIVEPTNPPTVTDLPTATNPPEATSTATNTATVTFTPEPSATGTPSLDDILEQELLQIPGIIDVEYVTVSINDGLRDVYAEIIVAPGTDYESVANALLQKTSQVYMSVGRGYSSASAIIDDGVTAANYNFDFGDDVWRVTIMESFNASRAAGD